MQKNFLKKTLIAITAVVLLVFFNNYFSQQWLRGAVLSFFRKPLGVSYSFLDQTKRRVVSWFSTGSLLRENDALRSENRQLVSTRLKISELEKENDFLRKELGVAKRKNLEVVLVRIFHRQLDGQSSTSLVDAGANEGIKAGMPVIFDGEVLYGLVKEVYADSALVYLITDPRISLNVKIVDSEIMGRSKGALSDGLSLELVANQEEVKPGQLVVTSGLDGLPGALVVGRIKTNQANRGGLFQKIEIEPQFPSLMVEKAFVLK